jgi:hypothetical protein
LKFGGREKPVNQNLGKNVEEAFLLPSPFDAEVCLTIQTTVMYFSRLNIRHQTSFTPKPCPIIAP